MFLLATSWILSAAYVSFTECKAADLLCAHTHTYIYTSKLNITNTYYLAAHSDHLQSRDDLSDFIAVHKSRSIELDKFSIVEIHSEAAQCNIHTTKISDSTGLSVCNW